MYDGNETAMGLVNAPQVKQMEAPVAVEEVMNVMEADMLQNAHVDAGQQMAENMQETIQAARRSVWAQLESQKLQGASLDTSKLSVRRSGEKTTNGINSSMSSSKRNVKKKLVFSELWRKKRNSQKAEKQLLNCVLTADRTWRLPLDQRTPQEGLKEFMEMDLSSLQMGTDQEFLDSYPTLERLFFKQNDAKNIYDENASEEGLEEEELAIKRKCQRKIEQVEYLRLYFKIRCEVIADPVYKSYKNSEIGNLANSHSVGEQKLHYKLQLLEEVMQRLEESRNEADDADAEQMKRQIAELKEKIDGVMMKDPELRQTELPWKDAERADAPVSTLEKLRILHEVKEEIQKPEEAKKKEAIRLYYRHTVREVKRGQDESPFYTEYGAEEQKLIDAFAGCMDQSWDNTTAERQNEIRRLHKMWLHYMKMHNFSKDNLHPEADKTQKLLCDIRDWFFRDFDQVATIPEGVKNQTYENPKLPITQYYVSQKGEPLFYTPPCVTDIQQRTVSDCYLLSALASIAYIKPDLIRERMIDLGDRVAVRFVDLQTDLVMHEELELKEGVSGQICLEKLFSKYGNDRLEKKNVSVAMDGDDGGFDVIEREGQQLRGEEQEAFDPQWTGETPEEMAERLRGNQKIDIKKMLGGNNKERFTKIAGALLNLQNSEQENEKKLSEAVQTLILNVQHQEKEEQEAFEDFVNAVAEQELYGTLEAIVNQVKEPVRVEIEEYVTVSKDIPRYMGIVDANAANSLWVQMIEKAFAVRYRKEKDTYDGLSYGTSFQFLEHFLGKEYRRIGDQMIQQKTGGDIRLKDLTLPKEQIGKIIDQQQEVLRENGYPNGTYAPDIMTVIKAIEDAQETTFAQENKNILEEALGRQYGLTYGIFDVKYSPSAIDVYNNLKDQLGKENIITVARTEGTIRKNNKHKTKAEREEERKTKELVDRLNADGIRVDHAYSVLAVDELKDGTKLVILKDPYCRFRRLYQMDEEAKERQVMKVVGENTYLQLDQSSDSGIFKVTLNDFMQIFNRYAGCIQPKENEIKTGE